MDIINAIQKFGSVEDAFITEYFTENTTWTVPNGVTQIIITALGPGGNGSISNAGGAGGGRLAQDICCVTPGSEISVIVGLPSNSEGGTGSQTVVSGYNMGIFTQNTISANSGSAASGNNGGSGGTGGGGSWNGSSTSGSCSGASGEWGGGGGGAYCENASSNPLGGSGGRWGGGGGAGDVQRNDTNRPAGGTATGINRIPNINSKMIIPSAYMIAGTGGSGSTSYNGMPVTSATNPSGGIEFPINTNVDSFIRVVFGPIIPKKTIISARNGILSVKDSESSGAPGGKGLYGMGGDVTSGSVSYTHNGKGGGGGGGIIGSGGRVISKTSDGAQVCRGGGGGGGIYISNGPDDLSDPYTDANNTNGGAGGGISGTMEINGVKKFYRFGVGGFKVGYGTTNSSWVKGSPGIVIISYFNPT